MSVHLFWGSICRTQTLHGTAIGLPITWRVHWGSSKGVAVRPGSLSQTCRVWGIEPIDPRDRSDWVGTASADREERRQDTGHDAHNGSLRRGPDGGSTRPHARRVHATADRTNAAIFAHRHPVTELVFWGSFCGERQRDIQR